MEKGSILQIGFSSPLYDIKKELLANFAVLSDHISNVSFNETTNQLAITQNGISSNYETAANSLVRNVDFTMPVDSPVAVAAVVIGVLTDGNYAVLILSGGGAVQKFYKDGHVAPTTLYTMSSPPTRAKGETISVNYSEDRVTFSYSGYSGYILYSSIPNWSYGAVGGLCTGISCVYTFVIND